ncbi:MAG: hypothetical protein ACKVVP_06235 [Chloroflexota bacterium]
MISHITEQYLNHFRRVPRHIQEQARSAYRLWQQNPQHPSLRFKRVHTAEPIYSVRVGRGWRVLGLREGDSMYWFWIGSHAEYDQLLAHL